MVVDNLFPIQAIMPVSNQDRIWSLFFAFNERNIFQMSADQRNKCFTQNYSFEKLSYTFFFNSFLYYNVNRLKILMG